MRSLHLIPSALLLVCLATPSIAAKYQEGEVSGGGAIQGSVL